MTKANQLQMMQQSLSNMVMQKQQLSISLNEINAALKEIENTDKSYKIIGNIMVSASKEDLTKELKSKKEVVELRLKNIESQEEKMREKCDELQKGVLEEMKNEK